MTSLMEQAADKQRAKSARRLTNVCNGGLHNAISALGGRLVGITIRTTQGDHLMTIRAEFDSGPMVAFVGSSDIANVLRKAFREARNNDLRWKVDRYAK